MKDPVSGEDNTLDDTDGFTVIQKISCYPNNTLRDNITAPNTVNTDRTNGKRRRALLAAIKKTVEIQYIYIVLLGRNDVKSNNPSATAI